MTKTFNIGDKVVLNSVYFDKFKDLKLTAEEIDVVFIVTAVNVYGYEIHYPDGTLGLAWPNELDLA